MSAKETVATLLIRADQAVEALMTKVAAYARAVITAED